MFYRSTRAFTFVQMPLYYKFINHYLHSLLANTYALMQDKNNAGCLLNSIPFWASTRSLYKNAIISYVSQSNVLLLGEEKRKLYAI